MAAKFLLEIFAAVSKQVAETLGTLKRSVHYECLSHSNHTF
jgi:hypothetical protein